MNALCLYQAEPLSANTKTKPKTQADFSAAAPVRSFTSLRISLTPLCNFSCLYCKPSLQAQMSQQAFTKQNFSLPQELPTQKPMTSSSHFYPPTYFSDMVARLTQVLDLKKIRLTGGEPLLYPHLPELIALLRKQGHREIALTTNGSLANLKLLEKLKNSGLTHINFSLDTLSAQTFAFLSGQKADKLQKVLQAIELARKLEFIIKINFIVMKGINSGELTDILQYCLHRNIPLRFLELMRMGYTEQIYQERFMGQEQILETLKTDFSFQALPREKHSTATYFALGKRHGKDVYAFGMIANESEPFCSDCNRLRLDSGGNLFGCLSSTRYFSLHDAQNEQELQEILSLAIQEKNIKFNGSSIRMLQIGG